MPSNLKTFSGKLIIVEDTPFAKGGEGSVHKIIFPLNSNLCAKIYFPKERNTQRKNKIEFMVHNPPPNLSGANHIICWSKEALYLENTFVGFTMPIAFNGSIQLYELCTPKLKAKLPSQWKKKFDRDSWTGIQSRLKLCTNLAAAINTVHQFKNYVLVDLKPQNVLVTDDGKVSLIDCDSIQISNNGKVLFPAKVATPEYVPPEGVKINPSKNIVPQSWDRFSMAIMFYEVIFGLHPYAATFNGPYQNSTTLDSKIKSGLFVHGENKKYISVLPPLHINFGVIPSSLKQLFNRAFEQGNQIPDFRPSAEEWGRTLFAELENRTMKIKPTVSIAQRPKPLRRPTTTKAQPFQTTQTINRPIKKEKGIGGWCILFGIFPVIGIIMTIVYFLDGKNKKGLQTLAAWIIGLIISILLTA